MSGKCLEGAWKVSKKFLEGVWILSGWYLEGIWEVSERCLEGVCDRSSQVRSIWAGRFGTCSNQGGAGQKKKFFGQQFFLDLKFLNPNFFS